MKQLLKSNFIIIFLAVTALFAVSYTKNVQMFGKAVFPIIDSIDKAYAKTDLNAHVRGDSASGYQLWGRNHEGTEFQISLSAPYVLDSLENYVKIKDSDGQESINSNTRKLTNSLGGNFLDWENGIAYTNTSGTMFDLLDAKFYSSGNVIFDLKQYSLYDAVNNQSENWFDRLLLDSLGNIAMRWSGLDTLFSYNYLSAPNLQGINTGDNIKGSYDSTVVSVSVFTVPIGLTLTDTTYFVSITADNILSAVPYFITNKTDSTFDANAVTGLTGNVSFEWSITK